VRGEHFDVATASPLASRAYQRRVARPRPVWTTRRNVLEFRQRVCGVGAVDLRDLAALIVRNHRPIAARRHHAIAEAILLDDKALAAQRLIDGTGDMKRFDKE